MSRLKKFRVFSTADWNLSVTSMVAHDREQSTVTRDQHYARIAVCLLDWLGTARVGVPEGRNFNIMARRISGVLVFNLLGCHRGAHYRAGSARVESDQFGQA